MRPTVEAAARAVEGIEIIEAEDRTFAVHEAGKLSVDSKRPFRDRDDLAMAYTPGVARVCLAIAKDPALVHRYTMKANTVAVVTDGTAVLGLGDIGPEAAMPVMEGKAVLFKAFAGVNAVPVCLRVGSPDELVETVQRMEPMFGGHQPRGHRRPPLLRGGAAAGGHTVHTRLPRRPARDGGGGAGRPA